MPFIHYLNVHPSTRLVLLVQTTLIIITMVLPLQQITRAESAANEPANSQPILCNSGCVVFRVDDIQDYWIKDAQLALMDLFISKNQSLSLGLIMNHLGNDSKIIDKVREGYQKGLFELAIHGWNHEDYTKLSQQEQQSSLQKANEKIKQWFGSTSNIFMPPLDPYNNDTLKSMSLLGIPILSSMAHQYNSTHNSQFVANGTHNNNIITKTIYHIPGTILFKTFAWKTTRLWERTPINTLLGALSAHVKKYGYAVLVLHPQNFVLQDNKTKQFVDKLDPIEIQDLSSLINFLLSKNIHIISYSKLIRQGTQPSIAWVPNPCSRDPFDNFESLWC